MTPYLLVGLGGAVGAAARFFVSTVAARRYGIDFPYGTTAVNVSGSAAMGFLLTLLNQHFEPHSNASLLATTGFLGAYTTFSTFAFEAIALIKLRRRWPLALYVGINVLGGAAGAGLGITAATIVDRHS